MADVVSVQRVSRDTVGHQVLLQGERDGGFTGSGETCERGPRVGWRLTICGCGVVVGMEGVGCWWECSADGMRVWGSGGNGGCRVLVGM